MASRFAANPNHFFNENAPYLIREAVAPARQRCKYCKSLLVTRRAGNGWVTEHETSEAKAKCLQKRAKKAKRQTK